MLQRMEALGRDSPAFAAMAPIAAA